MNAIGWTDAWILVSSLLGTHATYWLCKRTALGPIRATALPVLAFVGLTTLLPFASVPTLQTAFFGATFVGTTDSARLGEKKVLLASCVFSAIISVLTRFHGGLGGTLGTAAFVACLLVYGLGRWAKSD